MRPPQRTSGASAANTAYRHPAQTGIAPVHAPSAGYGNSMQGGGGIVVTHTTRQLKGYNFTDSDLETLGLTNVVSSVSFSLFAAIATFCFDINKDAYMAGDGVSAQGQALQFTVNWIGIPVALAFAVVGVVALVKRGSVIQRVKDESKNV